jgi:DNA-binding MarR family transcriptional regulator
MQPQQHKPVWQLPRDASPNCVGFRVRQLSRVVSSIYDEKFAPLKLKVSQFNILSVLSRGGPCVASELCTRIMMDKSTASRNLQRMRRRGWISAIESKGGRGQQVSLTPKGIRVLRDAYPLWKKAQQEAIRRLGPEGVKALKTVLQNVTTR